MRVERKVIDFLLKVKGKHIMIPGDHVMLTIIQIEDFNYEILDEDFLKIFKTDNGKRVVYDLQSVTMFKYDNGKIAVRKSTAVDLVIDKFEQLVEWSEFSEKFKNLILKGEKTDGRKVNGPEE